LILGIAGALYVVFLIKYFLEAKVREAKDSVLLLMKENKFEVASEVSPVIAERMS